jgi:hypothetical protein
MSKIREFLDPFSACLFICSVFDTVRLSPASASLKKISTAHQIELLIFCREEMALMWIVFGSKLQRTTQAQVFVSLRCRGGQWLLESRLCRH